MTKSEKVPILGFFSPMTILMFRVGLKKIGQVGNRNHTYISFKPYTKYQVPRSLALRVWTRRFLKGFYHIWAWLGNVTRTVCTNFCSHILRSLNMKFEFTCNCNVVSEEKTFENVDRWTPESLVYY